MHECIGHTTHLAHLLADADDGVVMGAGSNGSGPLTHACDDHAMACQGRDES